MTLTPGTTLYSDRNGIARVLPDGRVVVSARTMPDTIFERIDQTDRAGVPINSFFSRSVAGAGYALVLYGTHDGTSRFHLVLRDLDGNALAVYERR